MKYLLILSVFFSISACSTKSSKETPASPKDSAATPVVTPTEAAPSNPGTAEPVTTTPAVIAGNQVAIRFGSMASGPIGDEFLKNWLVKFKNEEKVDLTADKFSGCGKEGEYIIIINKASFGAEKDKKFNSGLKQLVEAEIKRTKAENASSGSVEIRQNPSPDEYSYCRLGSKKWL